MRYACACGCPPPCGCPLSCTLRGGCEKSCAPVGGGAKAEPFWPVDACPCCCPCLGVSLLLTEKTMSANMRPKPPPTDCSILLPGCTLIESWGPRGRRGGTTSRMTLSTFALQIGQKGAFGCFDSMSCCMKHVLHWDWCPHCITFTSGTTSKQMQHVSPSPSAGGAELVLGGLLGCEGAAMPCASFSRCCWYAGVQLHRIV
mmetsp:Transcript_14734/g.36061  ORF Transcript_14734/g.36061 Transcript_14734/m.36061 type:complete len:201 (-) Transcript_14734:191-793(-)